MSTKKGREAILGDVLRLLRGLADDWEYSGDVTQDTYLLAHMGLTSLDVVILANAVQQDYGQVLPFSEFFAEIGQREVQDVSVGEWVDFIYENLSEVA